jgi:site-specific DNA-methyltransferase (adenine-specific)
MDDSNLYVDNNNNIKLYKGDCLEVMQELIANKVKVDAVITDIPYGTTSCQWDTIIPLDKMWACINQLVKEHGVIALFSSQPFTSELVHSNIKNYKYEWVWEKQHGANFLLLKYQPFKVHENIEIFSNGSPLYYPQMDLGVPYYTREGGYHKDSASMEPHLSRIETTNPGTRYPKSIRFFNFDKTKIHPTQKPIALMEYLIKTYTLKGETVLDFTMGSGTTGVACKKAERGFIGIELDTNYYQIAKDRINNTDIDYTLFEPEVLNSHHNNYDITKEPHGSF